MLIWAGLWRKKTRTVFTMLSIIVAFLLFGLLQGVNLGMSSVLANMNVDRLFTSNKYSMVEGMPLNLANRIQSLPHVKHLSHLTYFGGYYQEAKNALPVFAADVPELFTLYPDLKIPREQVEAMNTTPAGAVISRDLATQYGWKIGDRVPVGTSIWTKKDGRNDYQFDIVGIFDAMGMGPTGPTGFYINLKYFDEERRFGNFNVHYYIVGVDNPLNAEATIKAIDGLTANSSEETKTQTEQAFAASQMQQLGDIGFIVNSIVGAVLFTLLFLTGNSMMQSMRERIPELAVLKTLGFNDGQVASFVLFEAVALCVVSALIGLGLSTILFQGMKMIFSNIVMPMSVVGIGIAIAVLVAFVSGLPPALRAKRLNIVDALAGR
jgi:putative ABC transport system permease protein